MFMLHGKQSWVRINFFFCWTIFAYFAVSVILAKDLPDTNGVPKIFLEKSTYVLGELIRFQIGVESVGTEIHSNYWNTCIFHITKPDGTVKKEPVPWPGKEGNCRWRIGYGLEKDDVETGKYILVFEFAGRKTEPVELFIEKLDILDGISAEFLFSKSGEIEKPEDVSVTLNVTNNTEYPVRIPFLGMTGTHISVRVDGGEPPSGSHFFYPPEKFPGYSVKTFVNKYDWHWETLTKVPFFTIKPGENFSLKLSLADVYQFNRSGEYEVTFSTTLLLFIGKENGKFAHVCPIRLPVVSAETFTLIAGGKGATGVTH